MSKKEDRIKKLEKEIEKIKLRNQKVELDKDWETSDIRRILLATLTYLVILLFFVILKLEKPFINALIATAGYYVSTFTLGLFKNIWIKRKLKR